MATTGYEKPFVCRLVGMNSTFHFGIGVQLVREVIMAYKTTPLTLWPYGMPLAWVQMPVLKRYKSELRSTLVPPCDQLCIFEYIYAIARVYGDRQIRVS